MDDLTLAIKLKLDQSNISSEAKKVSNSLNGTATGVTDTNKAVDKLANALQRLTGINFKNIVSGLKDIGIGAKTIQDVLAKSVDSAAAISNQFAKGAGRLLTAQISFETDDLDTFFKNTNNDLLELSTNLTNTLIKNKDVLKDLGMDWSKLVAEFSRGAVDIDKMMDMLYSDRFITSKDDDVAVMFHEYLSQYQESIAEFSRRIQEFGYNKLLKNADIATLEKSVNNTNLLGKAWTKVKDVIKAIPKAIKAIAASVLVFIAAVKLIKASIQNALDVSELGDNIDKTSQKLGLSAKSYQTWSYVLERCGTTIDKMKESMRQLTTSAGDSNKASLFEQLGIENASSLSQQELFNKTVEGLQNVTDTAERARIATKLLGEGATELAPLLNMTAQETSDLAKRYDALGATMSSKVVAASASLQNALTDLKSSWQGVKNTLAEGLIPIIMDIVNWLTLAVAKINLFIRAIFDMGDVGEEAGNNATSTLTDGLSSAVSTATKLKQLISGFDELNIFNSGTTDTEAEINIDYNQYTSVAKTTDSLVESINRFKNVLSGEIDWSSLTTGEKIAKALATALGAVVDVMDYIINHSSDKVFNESFFTGKTADDFKKYNVKNNGSFNLFGIDFGKMTREGSAWVQQFWNDTDEWTKKVFDTGKKNIEDGWGNIKSWWQTNVSSKITIPTWNEFWSPLTTWWKQSRLYSAVVTGWGNVKTYYEINIKPIFTKKFWVEKWNTIKQGLSEISLVAETRKLINGFINVMEQGINKLINELNNSGLLNFLRTLKFDIQLNPVSIPRLAKGGVIDRPTYALMGEYSGARTNPEIVAPQSILQQTIDTSNDNLVSVMTQIGYQIIQAINNQDMTVSIGDNVIAKSAAKGGKAIYSQTGKNVFAF